MQKTTLLLLALCLSTCLCSQSMADEGNNWTQAIPSLGPPYTLGYHFTEGDTLIDEEVYTKVYFWDLYTTYMDTIYYGAIRRTAAQVWFLPPNEPDNQPYLIYDWEKNVGDTLYQWGTTNYPIMTLDSIVLADGHTRIRYQLAQHRTNPDGSVDIFPNDITLIEGIGIIQYPNTFNPVYTWESMNFFDPEELICFRRDTLHLLQNMEFPSCDMVNNTDHTVQTELLLYPNPANDLLTLEFLSTQNIRNYRLLLYDIQGQIQYQQLLSDTAPVTLSVSHLPDGIYVVQLIDPQGRILAVRRFVRQEER